MHELGLTKDLVDIVTAKAVETGAKKIVSIRLVIGAISGIETGAVSFCFEVVSKGTIAEGARLDIDRVPLTLACRTCRSKTEVGDVFTVCGTCGSADVEIIAGREFTIKSMEVD